MKNSRVALKPVKLYGGGPPVRKATNPLQLSTQQVLGVLFSGACWGAPETFSKQPPPLSRSADPVTA